MSLLLIDVYSDFCCPWCYVGERRLLSAVESFAAESGRRIELTFHPYMIDPRIHKDGEEYMDYCRKRWGGDGRTSGLKQEGRQDGCAFGGWKVWANTLNAHMLVDFAQRQHQRQMKEAQDTQTPEQIAALKEAHQQRLVRLVDLLFTRAYEEGKNISLPAELDTVAAELGDIDASEFRKHLSDPTAVASVKEEDAEAKGGLSIRGVPYFIVRESGKTPVALSGAQPKQAFLELFKKMR
ncbi:unnamed protein product [Vitrella brassicaformis CCMP3155]|uniref:DSBA-like thioredoxin domain-containing protein n=1 Tax=Vitrella brassicaformis (strain CCMP3155) TaxID=1169540 RepID=A0A0G4EDT9_VITBC|nr:unnamed protein product [Vitrella brassicaformis CCMP3155]|mmetsp:Transcript_40842/g.102061  ORF Transcript_40842/g.102061 Transcript_40842/m.102061 type:complete len:238 (-) Transcript_40842:43-756(-)|eukprot:CEL93896.1 unnamed protein product [Vitrella brassicaformis CCMP3155]